jgi:hypothetical protein
MRTEIHRTVTKVKVDPDGGWTKLTMDCGHVAECNQVYTYKVGSRRPCYRCNYPTARN